MGFDLGRRHQMSFWSHLVSTGKKGLVKIAEKKGG